MKKGWNNPFAMIYLVSEKPDGRPVVLHDGETIPRHADCLHQDLGFCDPREISKVVFPIFKGNGGPMSITRDRWHSFGLFIERFDRNIVQAGDWTTYRHRDENPLLELVPVTMSEYLDAHPGERVAMWR
jgi:hypothetical protein